MVLFVSAKLGPKINIFVGARSALLFLSVVSYVLQQYLSACRFGPLIVFASGEFGS